MVQINFIAVLVSAFLNLAIGMIWYSPILFGKKWAEWTEFKIDPEKPINPMPLYLQSFLATILTYFVLAHFVEFTHSVTFQNGANTGFWCWLGFIMPV
ncbi:MAG: DUF1761 domain-containing protein [Ignavibacteria bacterium]|nr:DUF1761 domain-containing protein [Ignavibacteria bacterium]